MKSVDQFCIIYRSWTFLYYTTVPWSNQIPSPPPEPWKYVFQVEFDVEGNNFPCKKVVFCFVDIMKYLPFLNNRKACYNNFCSALRLAPCRKEFPFPGLFSSVLRIGNALALLPAFINFIRTQAACWDINDVLRNFSCVSIECSCSTASISMYTNRLSVQSNTNYQL